MIVCFSFDDGRSDFYKSSEILLKHNLKGTFHITTGFIDYTFHTDCFGNGRKPLTVDEIVRMNDCGMEISSHGDKHLTNTFDFRESYFKLSKWIKCNKIGFSIPNSRVTKSELNKFVSENKNILLYVRNGRNEKCYSLFSKIEYFCFHYILRLQFLYNAFNRKNLIYDIDRMNLHSIVVTSDIKFSHIKNFIKKYANQKCIAIFMFHSIVKDPKNKWEWSLQDFEKTCAFVSELCKTGDVLCKRIDEAIAFK